MVSDRHTEYRTSVVVSVSDTQAEQIILVEQARVCLTKVCHVLVYCACASETYNTLHPSAAVGSFGGHLLWSRSRESSTRRIHGNSWIGSIHKELTGTGQQVVFLDTLLYRDSDHTV